MRRVLPALKPGGDWRNWAPVLKGQSTAGAAVTAVPWGENRFALFGQPCRTIARLA
jgi:hypothetical protein